MHLLYAAELEQLSINITVESLIKYNKENLAKGIWRDHSDKSRVSSKLIYTVSNLATVILEVFIDVLLLH